MNKQTKGVLQSLALLSFTYLAGKFASQLSGSFGKAPSGSRFHRMLKSPHFRDGVFHNISPTPVMLSDASKLKIAKEFTFKPEQVKPNIDIPSVKTDLKSLTAQEPTVVWFGHSSYMILSRDYNILVDPVFSGQASPVSFFGKAFPGSDRDRKSVV